MAACPSLLPPDINSYHSRNPRATTLPVSSTSLTGHLSAPVREKLNCTTPRDDSSPRLGPKSGRANTSSSLPSTPRGDTISSSTPEGSITRKIPKGARKGGGAKYCAAAVPRPSKTHGVGVAGVPSGALSPETDGEESPGMPTFEGLEFRPDMFASSTTVGCRGTRHVRFGGVLEGTSEICAESGGVPGDNTTHRVPLGPRKCNKRRLTPDVGETPSAEKLLSINRLAAKAEEAKEGVVVPGGGGGENGEVVVGIEEIDDESLDEYTKTVDDNPSGRANEERLSEAAAVEGTVEAGGHRKSGGKTRAKATTGVGVDHTDARDVVNEQDVESNGGISEYELQRLERIKKNQAFMAALGLDVAKPLAPFSTISSGGGDPPGRKKRSEPAGRAAIVSVRRSSRTRKAKPGDDFQGNQEVSVAASAPTPLAKPQHVLEEIDYDDSTVLKYLCMEADREQSDGQGPASAEPSPVSGAGSEGARVVGVRTLGPDRPLSASGLSTIYSMHFLDCGSGRGERPSRALLAAGGKGGVVALFSARQPRAGTTFRQTGPPADEDDERTLMTFKAHKGWVSSVRFVRGGGGGSGKSIGSCCLLSSGNDSVVKVWDTSKADRGFPKLLCTANDLHPTSKGIFSMDSYGTRVATGSKDATVAIASLRPTGLAPDRMLGDSGGSEAFHTRVIKGVSLRDETTVASCGDDSSVCVSDVRVSTPSGVSYRLSSVHAGSCHTVRWHPRDENLLLTAGLDSTMKLFDLRRLEDPLHVFRGHCPCALARPRAIHRPEFFSSGKGSFNAITCGERSAKLSMYDVSSGATASRGLLGDEATALAVLRGIPSGVDTIAAAMPGGAVLLLAPVWASD